MNKKENLDHVRLMVLSAMLTALSVLLTRLASFQIGEAMRFGFGTIPIILSGLIAGPVYGFAVGIAADLIGSFINLMGQSFIIGLTLCSGLLGAVPALIYKVIFKKKNNIFTLSIAVLFSEIIISGVLKSVFLWQMYGGSFGVWLVPKLIAAAIMSVAEIAIIVVLLNALKKSSFAKKYINQ